MIYSSIKFLKLQVLFSCCKTVNFIFVSNGFKYLNFLLFGLMIRMKKTMAPMLERTVVVLFLAILYVQAGAQKLESTLATYADKYSQERAYLHYDKSTYAAGETVWFKAYLMENILPAQGSKTLYVDWVDEKGEVLAHVVSPVIDAVANGQFDIPADYSGNFI